MARTWKDLDSDDLYAMRRLEFTGYSRDEMLHAVNDAHWQKVRLQMKGMSTRQKLDILRLYLIQQKYQRAASIQVNNYLDALRRGGQLPPRGWHG